MENNIKMYKYFVSIITILLFANQLTAQEEASLIKEGDIMPQFKIDLEKGEINSNDLKGKVILINFFATWCPPCRKELPYVEKQIWNKHKDCSDFQLLIIGREHSIQEMKKFQEEKYQMPFYPDEDRSIYTKFALSSIPRNYIINKEGKVIYTSIGFSVEEFEKMVKLLDKELDS